MALPRRAARRADIAKTHVIALAIPLSPLSSGSGPKAPIQDIAFSNNRARLYHEAWLVKLLSLTQISRSLLVCFDVASTRHVCDTLLLSTARGFLGEAYQGTFV